MSAVAIEEDLVRSGYVVVDEFKELRPGVRVYHRGEQWFEAANNGTATVLRVFERAPSSWTQTYNARDVELIVEHDDGSVRQWANYHCVLPSKEAGL